MSERTYEELRPTQFRPGQSGNPHGRPKLSEDEKFMREHFQKAFHMLGTKTISEIQAIAKDPTQPAPYAIAAKAVDWAFKKGNPAMYREIWDRTLGPVKQEVDHNLNSIAQVNVLNIKEDVRSLSDGELKERVKLMLNEPVEE